MVPGRRCQQVRYGLEHAPEVSLIALLRPPRRHGVQEGDGFKIAMQALDGGRINIGACSVGGAQFCLDTARTYTQQRQQFGSLIASYQATQFRIADMATQVQVRKRAPCSRALFASKG